MKLTKKGSLAGLILAGILVMMPGAAFAHGGGGHGFSGHASLLASGRAVTPRVQSGNDQGFYQPARDPQFNTARDQ